MTTETKKTAEQILTEMVATLDTLESATNRSDVTGHCERRSAGTVGTCIHREMAWRSSTGEAKGFLNLDREKLCLPCRLHHAVGAARLYATDVLQRKKLERAREERDAKR